MDKQPCTTRNAAVGDVQTQDGIRRIGSPRLERLAAAKTYPRVPFAHATFALSRTVQAVHVLTTVLHYAVHTQQPRWAPSS